MFGRKRKKKRISFEVKRIPLPILMRQAIYDSMLEPSEGIAEALGLSPVSDEVALMEEQESQKRLENISVLIPFIESHSDMSARICAAAYALGDDEEGLLNELLGQEGALDLLTDLFKVVCISSSMSCVSTLLNLELIDTKVGYYDGE
jgi:hypothetical protein